MKQDRETGELILGAFAFSLFCITIVLIRRYLEI
jgi:hypothetical protein